MPDNLAHSLTRLAETVPEYLGSAIINAVSGEVVEVHARSGGATHDLATWAAAGARLLLTATETSMAEPLAQLRGQHAGSDPPQEAWLVSEHLVQLFVRDTHTDRLAAVLCRRTTSMGLLLTLVRSTLEAAPDPATSPRTPTTHPTTTNSPVPQTAPLRPDPPSRNPEAPQAKERTDAQQVPPRGPAQPDSATPTPQPAPVDSQSSAIGDPTECQNPPRDASLTKTSEPASSPISGPSLPRRHAQPRPWDLAPLTHRSPTHGFDEEAAEVDESLLKRVLGGLRTGRS